MSLWGKGPFAPLSDNVFVPAFRFPASYPTLIFLILSVPTDSSFLLPSVLGV